MNCRKILSQDSGMITFLLTRIGRARVEDGWEKAKEEGTRSVKGQDRNTPAAGGEVLVRAGSAQGREKVSNQGRMGWVILRLSDTEVYITNL